MSTVIRLNKSLQHVTSENDECRKDVDVCATVTIAKVKINHQTAGTPKTTAESCTPSAITETNIYSKKKASVSSSYINFCWPSHCKW